MANNKGGPIRCRAQVSEDCYHGKPEFDGVYDPEGPGQSEDGTWDGRSVVCDPCYIRLGTPTLAEIPERIAVARAAGGEEDGMSAHLREAVYSLDAAERMVADDAPPQIVIGTLISVLVALTHAMEGLEIQVATKHEKED